MGLGLRLLTVFEKLGSPTLANCIYVISLALDSYDLHCTSGYVYLFDGSISHDWFMRCEEVNPLRWICRRCTSWNYAPINELFFVAVVRVELSGEFAVRVRCRLCAFITAVQCAFLQYTKTEQAEFFGGEAPSVVLHSYLYSVLFWSEKCACNSVLLQVLYMYSYCNREQRVAIWDALKDWHSRAWQNGVDDELCFCCSSCSSFDCVHPYEYNYLCLSFPQLSLACVSIAWEASARLASPLSLTRFGASCRVALSHTAPVFPLRMENECAN